MIQDLVTLASVAGGSAFGIKLLNTVANGIGGLWEPIHAKRMAAVERDANQSQAETDAEIAMVKAQSDADVQELAIRTGERLFKLELRRQKNIETILAKAAQESHVSVSDKPVSEDWTVNFFESCKDIADDEMQRLWGKILAGEVVRPGSFSLRTVQFVKMLTTDEAALFKRLCCYCWREAEKPLTIYWRGNEDYIYPELDTDALGHLGSIGLISEGLREMFLTFPTKDGIHLSYFGRRFFLETATDRPNAGATRVVTQQQGASALMSRHVHLTSIGRELVSIAGGEPNFEYMTNALAYMMTCNRGTLTELT